MTSRRTFLAASPAFAALGAGAEPAPFAAINESVSLNGPWQFRLDSSGDWSEVTVPHTWQTDAESAEYYGVAWYQRTFRAPRAWEQAAVRVEFEAVFHSAVVSVNGKPAGEHTGKGYTAFAIDISKLLRYDDRNVISVRVDNSFSEHMLPRGRSSDWAHDGGIYRPVTLLVTPKLFIERVDVEAVPDGSRNSATMHVTAAVRNTTGRDAAPVFEYRVIEERTGRIAAAGRDSAAAVLKQGETREIAIGVGAIDRPLLWHFDRPEMYRLEVDLVADGRTLQTFATHFGVRSFEIKDGAFHLNGERVRLMGVERMAGSNPEFGMAEPEEWLRHDHDDMKELNCVFTRVHWPQDRRVLDYCDRHGILIQTEVPTWGPDTFKGMSGAPSADIMDNGLEQLTEMIRRDRNHPSIFAWGLCNEIGGQQPAAYEFARRMYEHAKALDPRRLRSYASHSLRATPERDVAGLMDFIEFNEYYGSWYPGGPNELRKNLDEIHRAFPGKPLVISEYGYCACTADRPEGDAHRIGILRSHDAVFRELDYIGGVIFFCYNDYRTHVGDKGEGVMKQRVHGVVDLYGARKPSYEVLRSESSPVASIEVKGLPTAFEIEVVSRGTVPAHTMCGYALRAVLYGDGDIPLERRETTLPPLAPGTRAHVKFEFKELAPRRVRFDVLRPTGFSVQTLEWTA
jgi:beta-galactosidase